MDTGFTEIQANAILDIAFYPADGFRENQAGRRI